MKYWIILVLTASCLVEEKPQYIQEEKNVCEKRKNNALYDYNRYSLIDSSLIFPAVIPVLTETGFCTGTIIGNCTVLTAAHCFGNKNKTATIYTYIDKYNEVIWIKKHPKYKHTEINDIAIIRFKYEIEGVTPIPIDLEDLTIGEQVYLVGYGSSEKNRIKNKRYGKNLISWFSQKIIELKGPRATSLPGDSGGPILRKREFGYTEVGINTMYVHPTDKGKEISYAERLDVHHRFIMETTFDDIYFFQYKKMHTDEKEDMKQ